MNNLNNLTLLYIEDDNELRKQFVRILSTKFKKIYEATNGVEALKKYEDYSPDMMLVDINIPKINGLDVIEEVRKSDKNTPIVILSAYSDQEILLRAVKLGLSEYLIKPVPHKKLLTVLQDMALRYQTEIEENNLILLKNDYSWKKKERVLCYGDDIIPLTKRERIFLSMMVDHVDSIVAFSSISYLIWEHEENQIAYNSFSHLLKRLKKKLPVDLIENIYGEGYRITSS